MDFSEFTHTQPKLVTNIYERYLEGYTVEEIYWYCTNMLNISLSFTYINMILDYCNQLN